MSLREIHVPSTVNYMASTACAGCEDVVVYGRAGGIAEYFAEMHGFLFVEE